MTPIRLQAAGGVLYRRRDDTEVLLIHRLGVWDLPKGKMKEGEGREDCARREVAEEVGLDRLPRITAPLGETRHTYLEDGREVEKQTYWYAMDGEPFEEFTPQREEHIERIAWVPLAEARRRVGYDNLVKVLETFRDVISAGGR